jgi:HAE1 family hydrophobic/amphiphilic exporter-1
VLERGFDIVFNVYEAGLKIVLRHRLITLMVMFATVALTGYLYVIIPKGFFPQQDTGLILGFAEAGQDISYKAMAQRTQALIDAVLEDPAVASVGTAIGFGGGNYTTNTGRMFISLKPKSQRDASADQIILRLQQRLAKIQGIALYMQAAQDITIGGRLNKTQYQYTLADSDPGELSHWAPLFLEKIRALPGITGVTTDQLNSGLLLDITINRDVASSYGITPSAIDNTLNDAYGQEFVSTMYTQINQYHVVLEVPPKYQNDPEALGQLYVSSSTGQQVPLRTLITSAIKVAPLVVNHQGQFPSVTISYNLLPGTSLGQAVAAIQQVEKDLGKPLSLQTSFQGNGQAYLQSLKSTPLLILAALVVIYLILGILYESIIHPVTIISTLPSAGVGALLLLMAAHLDLSVIGIVGILLLIGIVKKNGIMLIDFAQEAEHGEGLTAEESIYKACTLRFRPILMTTMAALLGAVPMMLGTGNGAELRQPLGYAIVGGLALSQLLTLYTTPVIYIYFDRLQTWMFRRRTPAAVRPEAGQSEAPPAE